MLGSNKRESGFTLIELMVILVIMGTLLSLVGPMAVKNVEKMSVKTEEMQFKNWLSKSVFSAFNRGVPVNVKLEGHSATALVRSSDGQSKTIDLIQFDSLFFQPQDIHFNKNGFFLPGTAYYQLAGETYELDLLSVMKSK